MGLGHCLLLPNTATVRSSSNLAGIITQRHWGPHSHFSPQARRVWSQQLHTKISSCLTSSLIDEETCNRSPNPVVTFPIPFTTQAPIILFLFPLAFHLSFICCSGDIFPLPPHQHLICSLSISPTDEPRPLSLLSAAEEFKRSNTVFC